MNTIIFTHSFFTLDDKTDLSCSGIIYLRYQLHSCFVFFLHFHVRSIYYCQMLQIRIRLFLFVHWIKSKYMFNFENFKTNFKKDSTKFFRIFLVYDIMLKCLCFLNCLSYCYRKNLHHPGLLNVAKTPDTVNSDL